MIGFLIPVGQAGIPLLLAPQLGLSDPVQVGWLIGTMFFVSGLTTLLQTTLGNRLPIVQGGTFSFLAPTIAICGMAALADSGWQVRMQHGQGAIILGAVVEIVVGYSGLTGRLLRFIGPVTMAPTIALIGLALFKLGAPIAGSHWGIGGLTIVLMILCNQYLRRYNRFLEMFPILLAMIAAWLVAAGLSLAGVFTPDHPAFVNPQAIIDALWLRVPYPFQWGWPVFGGAAFVGMLAGYLASMVESIGDYFACARLSGAPLPNQRVVRRGIGAEGIGCLVAGIFGTGNGTTSYSENIGAIGLTRVGSRRVVQAGAVMMLFLGVVGKFGAVFATIPQPIVGGLYCCMFGMIVAVGLSNLQFVDLNSARNLFIIGFAFFMGLSLPEYFSSSPIAAGAPAWLGESAFLHQSYRGLIDIVNTLGQTGMAIGAFFALVLDNSIPGPTPERDILALHDATA